MHSTRHDEAASHKQGRTRLSSVDSASTSQHHRSRSWSSWVKPPDLFGYGTDMLKGWKPGQGSKHADSGTIIPIMADTQTTDGIATVTSTISAYCTSHNLLLSGVIVVPSVLCPRYTDLDAAWQGVEAGDKSASPASRSFDRQSRTSSSGDGDLYDSWLAHSSPPLSPSTAALMKTFNDDQTALRNALSIDVVQSKALLTALYPALRRDRGRIVALVPSGHGSSLPDTHTSASKLRQRPTVLPSATHLESWPAFVVDTVRDTLRQQYTDLSLEYARRLSSSGRPVWVSTIESQALMQPPSVQSKKTVQWDESVNCTPTQPRSVATLAGTWVKGFLSRLFASSRSDAASVGDLSAQLHYDHDAGVESAKVKHSVAGGGDAPSCSLAAWLVAALLVRAVWLMRWAESCALPFDDLSDLIAAVSQPITAQFRASEPAGSHYAGAPSRQMESQNPDPLFEALRSALASHHPRRTYTPSLAAATSSYLHMFVPWIHSHIKYAVAYHILATTPLDS